MQNVGVYRPNANVAFYSWPDICIANEKRWPRRKNKQNLQISKFHNADSNYAATKCSIFRDRDNLTKCPKVALVP